MCFSLRRGARERRQARIHRHIGTIAFVCVILEPTQLPEQHAARHAPGGAPAPMRSSTIERSSHVRRQI